MDNERAIAIFECSPPSTSSERLRAARFLAQNATNSYRIRLSKIREAEHNSWVIQALDQALTRSGEERSIVPITTAEEQQESPVEARLYEELRAQAIEETSAWFLHELRPLIGFIDEAADAEIDRYACSRTKASLERVQSFLDAIERLRKASEAPAIKDFDLTDLVVRVAEDEAKQGRATFDEPSIEIDEDTALDDNQSYILDKGLVKLSLARRDPISTTGDPTLVAMAVTNALRNAIEAVMEVRGRDRHDVVLNWSVTDSDGWIVVLDEGCGLPPGSDLLTEPGKSTKSKRQGHLGMGLPIAQRAMESIGGTLQLTPRPGGGVSCELRWPCGDVAE